MNMEFYRNFIAMVEAGGMNKASRDIHVAQPALTRQLKIMEKEYGAPLVKPRRGRHRLELTEAGWIFYRQAKQICEVDDTTRSEIETLTEGLKGTLRISLSPSLSPQLIENVIRPFHEAYPDLTFRLRESYHMPLIDEVRRGISEIGIANAPLPDPSLFHILSQRSASLAVLGPAGDPFLGEQETLNLSALAGHPLAVSRRTEEILKRLCREAGVKPTILASVDARASALLFAEGGMAYAVVMWNEGEPVPEGLLLRPLSVPSLHPGITCFTLKDHKLSKGMEHFMEYMK